ncbi:UDP-glycosyltransferase 74E2 [Cryptomeria japonica]|uniref:UDP-glycosyltransferase 74E2 n=1 Tax=Cryptomeria japonica TaxID=3369 RepID=UPI0027D9F030|nr:UDP-glycosyltransferase 74E2 [Cryptomeria japonica]
MASGTASGSAHVVVLAFPQAGHTNPMLQFSKDLASQGVIITLVSFAFDHHRMLKADKTLQRLGIRIRFESIPDRLPPGIDIVSDVLYVFSNLQHIDGSDLEELIHRLNVTGPPVTCIVYDAFMPWVAQVSTKLKIPRAVFYTQSATVAAIYHHFKYVEKWNNCEQDSNDVVVIPAIGEMRMPDLPSIFFPPLLTAGCLDINLKLIESFNGASWVILNSFDELESKAINYLREANVPVCTVGSLIPSAFLDRINSEDTQFGGSPWEEETEECMEWLNSKPPHSVVYVSFGSIAAISTKQLREIGRGLQSSEQNFLWVIRSAAGQGTVWEGFAEEIGDRGLIVKWSPQLKVLNHPSVGAFMSHCGWNSTVEGLSAGVPMLGCDLCFDQPTNCKVMVEVWKMGVKLKRTQQDDGDVTFEWDEIERCVRRVICSEEGAELRKNAVHWKESAKTATMEGGSSHSNVSRFVKEVTKFRQLLVSQLNEI